MKTFHDVNQSWTPPVGYTFIDICTKGSYLVIVYAKRRGDILESQVDVYLNDNGREVCRFTETWEHAIKPIFQRAADPKPLTLTRWQRFVKWAEREAII